MEIIHKNDTNMRVALPAKLKLILSLVELIFWTFSSSHICEMKWNGWAEREEHYFGVGIHKDDVETIILYE